ASDECPGQRIRPWHGGHSPPDLWLAVPSCPPGMGLAGPSWAAVPGLWVSSCPPGMGLA
ncbi:hypothetical protein NDU88_006889, partial [Pleurodeles waltl]